MIYRNYEDVHTQAAQLPKKTIAVGGAHDEVILEMVAMATRKDMAQFILVGKEEEILVEGLSKRSNQAISGKGRHAVSITVDGCADDIGKIIRCRVTGIKNNTLMGARIK